MKRDVFKFLEDIRLSIDALNLHIANVETLEAYSQDLKTIDAVERRLAIIGEALFKADKLEPNIQITDKTKIIGLRHILVHDYDLINDATIWKIVQNNLPVLRSEVVALLNKTKNNG